MVSFSILKIIVLYGLSVTIFLRPITYTDFTNIMEIAETFDFTCSAIYCDVLAAHAFHPGTDGKLCIYNSGVTISSCSADDYSVQRFCPCAMNRITIAESSDTIPVSGFPPATIFQTPTQILGQQSTDSNLVLCYSFAPETITGNIVSNMAAAQFAGITGMMMQMGPTGINNQLILSSAQKQYLVTATPFSTGSPGLSIACWVRSPSISQVWARILDFGNERSKKR